MMFNELLILATTVTTVTSMMAAFQTTSSPSRWSPITTIDSSAQNETLDYTSTTPTDMSNPQRCTPTYCFGLRYEDVLRFYGGLFMSTTDIYSRGFISMERQTPQTFWWSSTPGTNGRFKRQVTNHCCQPIVHYIRQNRMMNIAGEIRDILQLTHLTPPKYQWYPQVTCLTINRGVCRTENSTIQLLVYRKQIWTWPFEFDMFQVPGSCMCSMY